MEDKKYITKDYCEVAIIDESPTCYYLRSTVGGYVASMSKDLKIEEWEFYKLHQGLVSCENKEELMEIRKSKAYGLWIGILSRVGRGKYKDVTISSSWCIFNVFKVFFDKYYKEGFVIDKDLLSEPGKKCYSGKTCTFIPFVLNTAIRECSVTKNTFKKNKSGEYYFYLSGMCQNLGSKTVKAQSLKDICEKYAIYRCTRVLTLASLYWHDLTERAREALVKKYDYKNFSTTLYEEAQRAEVKVEELR